MKAVYTNNNWSNKIVVGDKATPRITAHQVLIKVHAASINPIDHKFPRLLAPFYPFSIILGRDAAGEIVAVGNQVTKFKLGDHVYGLKVYPFRGSYAQYYAISANSIAHIPKHLSLTTAAAVPLVSLTALQAFRWAGLKPADKVLIIGGSGGVGHAAVQLAKINGAHVSAVCSGKNSNFVACLGADQVIDYTQDDIVDLNSRFDIIFDTIGNYSYRQLRHLLRPQGRYVTTLPTLNTLFDNLVSATLGRFIPRFKRSYFNLLTAKQADLEQITQLIENHQFAIHISKTFALEDTATAIEESKRGRTVGKSIILINQS